jgi:hypothetical protein
MRLFHYDGSSWQKIGTEVIQGNSWKLWDVEGDLYFATKTAIYRVQDEEVEVLLDTHGAANQEVLSLWASKPGRIYAVIRDIQAVSEEECTQVKVLHYRDESWQPLRD